MRSLRTPFHKVDRRPFRRGSRCHSGRHELFEALEPRLLLSAADNPAVQLFNVSPALFVENQGQWADGGVRFVHTGDGANVAMTDAGPMFQVFRQDPQAAAGVATQVPLNAGLPGDAPSAVPTQMLPIQLPRGRSSQLAQ